MAGMVMPKRGFEHPRPGLRGPGGQDSL